MSKLTPFKKPSIQRLGFTAGVKSMTAEAIKEVERRAKYLVEEITKKIVTITEYAGVKTVREQDARHVLKQMNMTVYGIAPDKLCKLYSAKKSDALKKILFYQQQHDCLYFAKSVFKKYLKQEIDLRVGDSASALIQHAVEVYIIKLLKRANKIAINAKRQRVTDKDVQLAVVLCADEL